MERNERFPSRLGECAINRCSLLAREGLHLDSQRKVIEAYVTVAVSVRSLASRRWSLNRIAYSLCRGSGVPGTPDRPEAGSGNSRTPEINKKSFTAQPVMETISRVLYFSNPVFSHRTTETQR